MCDDCFTKPIEETPFYWIGRIRAIVEMKYIKDDSRRITELKKLFEEWDQRKVGGKSK